MVICLYRQFQYWQSLVVGMLILQCLFLSCSSYLRVALGLVVDAVVVELEGPVVGVDADRDGALAGDGLGQGLSVVDGEVHVPGHCGGDSIDSGCVQATFQTTFGYTFLPP